MRLLIEPEVARLAAANITPEYAQRLKHALEVEELPISSLSEDMERKQKVHIILAEMCGNRILEALVRSLMGLTRRAVEAAEADPDYMHPTGMHRPIVEAVVAGNAEAAAAAMKKHTVEFGENLIKMEKDLPRKKFTPWALNHCCLFCHSNLLSTNIYESSENPFRSLEISGLFQKSLCRGA